MGMRGDRCVLVTGATGAVGPAVVATLCSAGFRVRVLARRKPNPGELPSGVAFCQGDIRDLPTLVAVSEGCHGIVHMAALLHIVDVYPGLEERYKEINVRGTEHVVQAAMQAGVQRLVFTSTIGVYGASQGQVLTEASQPRPSSLYAYTKLKAEEHVLGAYRGNNPIGVVLRLAAVYGPRLKGNYLRLLQALARGRFVPIGPGRNRRTLVYDRDVAAAVLLALSHPRAAGRIYNVTDGAFHTVSEIVAAISKALGKPPPAWYLPERPVKMMSAIMDRLTTFLPISSLHLQAVLGKYMEDVAVSGVRIQEELGFAPRYDLEQGWQDTIDRLRQVGIV